MAKAVNSKASYLLISSNNLSNGNNELMEQLSTEFKGIADLVFLLARDHQSVIARFNVLDKAVFESTAATAKYTSAPPIFESMKVGVSADLLLLLKESDLKDRLKKVGIKFMSSDLKEILGDFWQISYAHEQLYRLLAKKESEDDRATAAKVPQLVSLATFKTVQMTETNAIGIKEDFDDSEELKLVVDRDLRTFINETHQESINALKQKIKPIAFKFTVVSSVHIINAHDINASGGATDTKRLNAALKELHQMYDNYRQTYSRVVVKCDDSDLVSAMYGVTSSKVGNEFKVHVADKFFDSDFTVICLKAVMKEVCKALHDAAFRTETVEQEERRNPIAASTSSLTPLPAMNSNRQTEFFVKSCRILVYSGDLTKLRCDAIVNAANKELRHGGGIAGAILKAAGPKIQHACNQISKHRGVLADCDVATTDGYSLPCKYVIHAVGPNGNYCSKMEFNDKLQKVYSNLLEEAVDKKVSTLGLPLISAGVFLGSHSKQLCADAVWNGIQNFGKISELKEIHIVNLDHDTTNCVLQAAAHCHAERASDMAQRSADNLGTSYKSQSSNAAASKKPAPEIRAGVQLLKMYSRPFCISLLKRSQEFNRSPYADETIDYNK